MLEKKKLIDLTMMIEEGMQTFCAHWHPFVEITQMGRHGIENRETRKIILGTHTGTHVDAPLHFVETGETVENIPLDCLVGPATVLDFSHAADFQEISVSDLEETIGSNPKERLIFRFDWDKRALGTSRYYTDHPFLSEDACIWLVENGCRLIALDAPQPDNPVNGLGAEKDGVNHRILLGSNIIIVEYLIHLNLIKKKVVDLVVAPLKIKGADGAPARCFVMEDA